jgi:hypothetical protein
MAKKKTGKIEEPYTQGEMAAQEIIREFEKIGQWSTEQFYEALDGMVDAIAERNMARAFDLKNKKS